MRNAPTVVGFDGSAGARAAVDWALDDATRTGAPVRLVHAATGAVEPAGVASAAKVARYTHPTVLVSGVTLDGPAGDVLCGESEHAGLLVVGNRGRGGLAGLLLGSVSAAVSARARCPVVVVRERMRPRVGGHVVVGVDGSPAADMALGFAFEQAEARRIPLHVVRVYAPPAVPWRDPGVESGEVAAAELAAVDAELAKWRGKHPDVLVTAEVEPGVAGPVMADASRYAELAVVGSRGHAPLAGALLGSVSQHLLHHARCPVAVVRERA